MIDLQQFCSREDDIRDYMQKPWTHKGWSYGCNGHVLVRVSCPEHADTVADHPLAEKAPAILEKAGKAAYIPVPPFPAPKQCEFCKGKGQLMQEECDDCDGQGYFDHGRHEYQCKECDGDGRLPAGESGTLMDCGECHGIGYVRAGASVGDSHFDVVYLRLLAQLPNVRICTNGAEAAAHFTFDGGEGVLMPRHQ